MLNRVVTASVLFACDVTAKDMIVKNCLSQSFSIGQATTGTDFDQMSEIVENLASDDSPYEYTVCINDQTKRLISFQMTFADKMGESKIVMPLAGPETPEGTEGITCTSLMFENRGSAKFANIFEIGSAVSGLGIAYPPINEGDDNILIKLGKASTESVLIELNSDQIIRGFFGSATETELT